MTWNDLTVPLFNEADGDEFRLTISPLNYRRDPSEHSLEHPRVNPPAPVQEATRHLQDRGVDHEAVSLPNDELFR